MEFLSWVERQIIDPEYSLSWPAFSLIRYDGFVDRSARYT